MRLAQGGGAETPETETVNAVVKKESKGSTATSVASDKLKASNFPASLLRIGRWEVEFTFHLFQCGFILSMWYSSAKKSEEIICFVMDGSINRGMRVI